MLVKINATFISQILLIVCLSAPVPALAEFVNGGFESGDLSGWSSIGKVTAETSGSIGVIPPEGRYQAFIESANPGDFGVPASELENFLSLPQGTLDGLSNGPVIQGSGLQQVFTAQAGDTLSFSWNFLTDAPEPDFNDFAFVVLREIDISQKLSDSLDNLVLSNSSIFSLETGYRKFSYSIQSTGSYAISIGVLDVGDEFATSGLLVDNFRITSVPEPFGMTSLGIGLMTLAGYTWHRRHRSAR